MFNMNYFVQFKKLFYMKQIIIILCFAFVALSINAQTNYVVCYDNVQIHTTADLNGPTSGELKKNDKVNVISTSGEWAVIDHNGNVAYVLKYFLKKNDTEAVESSAVSVTVEERDKPKDDSVVKKTEGEEKIETQSAIEKSSNDAESYFAVTVAYSFQNITTGVKSNTNTELFNGFNFGYYLHRHLLSHLVFVSGLNYQFTIKGDTKSGISTYITNHNLKIPLRLGYSLKFGKNNSFSAYAGPSLDFNVSTQNEVRYSGDVTTTDVVNGTIKSEINGKKSSKKDSDYKSLNCFDIPIGIGIAFKFSKFGIRIEYEWGLVNRYIKDYRDAGAKWRSDQFTAGFLIII